MTEPLVSNGAAPLAGEAREDESSPVVPPVVPPEGSADRQSSFLPPLLDSWVLRATALVGVMATALGRVVWPGLRGNAPERVFLLWEQVTNVFGYAFWLLLSSLVVRSAFEIARLGVVSGFTRVFSMAGAGIVVAILFRALTTRLEVPLTIVLASSAILAALGGALRGLRAPHTRAVAGVLLFLATAALLRLFAWQLAAVAGEHANPSLYDAGRAVATAAVVVEGLGQLLGATWIGSRSRTGGQLLAAAAIAVSFVVTWGAARGAHGGSGFLEVVLHHGLLDAAGVPPPFKLGAFATFLVPSGTCLALAAALQASPLAALPCAASLALLAHGSYDVPLRALAATAAGQWVLLVSSHPRAMWRVLAKK